MKMIRGSFGDFKEEPRSISRDCDEEEEDETVTERLVGLTEMFPEPIRNVICNVGYYGFEGTKSLVSFTRQAAWIAVTSFTILALPIMFDNEKSQVEQSQIQQQRQLLLGPHAMLGPQGSPNNPNQLAPKNIV